MRYFVSLACLVALVASPPSVHAQQDEDPIGALEEPRRHPHDRRTHPDPSTNPALKLELDSSALEVTPAPPPTLKELEQAKRRKRIGIGVGVTVVVVLAISVAAAVTASSVKRMEVF